MGFNFRDKKFTVSMCNILENLRSDFSTIAYTVQDDIKNNGDMTEFFSEDEQNLFFAAADALEKLENYFNYRK